MRVDELRMIVTGAAGGIGRACCIDLCRAGARIVAVDNDQRGLEALACEASRAGIAAGALISRHADVSKEADVIAAVADAVRACGSINGLVNNAGIYRDGLLIRVLPDERVLKMPLAQWSRVLDVDLTGAFLMAREVAAHMAACHVRPGLIVNIASLSRAGFVGQSNYSAAKAGLVADMRVWALELAPFGIRVAALAPGLIDTSMLNAMDPGVLQDWIAKIPIGRLGTPEEIAAGIRFIVECDYFNGRCLDIDGGLGG